MCGAIALYKDILLGYYQLFTGGALRLWWLLNLLYPSVWIRVFRAGSPLVFEFMFW
jgi:hypothetical protein